MNSDLKNLIAYKKLQDACVFLHPVIARFPKSERFVLGQEIEGCLVSAVRRVVRIIFAGKDPRLQFAELALDLEMTEHFLSLARRMNFLSARQFGAASEKMEEIERIVRGWRRSRGA